MKCKGTKRDGNPCGHDAAKGREYCRFHGGHAPRGPAHWNYQGKGWSKYLPAYLAEKFQESLTDAELLEYREQIALLNARRKVLLEAAESELLWTRAAATFKELEGAITSGHVPTMNAAMTALHDLFKRGHQDTIRWREIYELIEREGRTKEREHKRLVQMEQMISAEQFLAVIGLIVNAVTQNVKDKDTLRSITRSIDAIWAAQGGGTIPTVH